MPDAGESVEVVVEGVGDGGAKKVRAFKNEGDFWSLSTDGPQVADVGEVATQETGGVERRGWEFMVTFEGGPFVEFLPASLHFDPAAEIVVQDDIETREEHLGEKLAEAAESGDVGGEIESIVDISVKDEASG